MNGFSLLLVGGAAYKIGQAQAQQIQQHTGRPPEDLSPEELENAMDTLNIEPQDLNDQDRAAIDAEAVESPPQPGAVPVMSAANTQSVVSPPPTQPAALADAPAYIAELQHLAELRGLGIITDDEFDAKKKQLLGL